MNDLEMFKENLERYNIPYQIVRMGNYVEIHIPDYETTGFYFYSLLCFDGGSLVKTGRCGSKKQEVD
jgi:hypothetical protein